MKLAYLLVILLFTLSACVKDTTANVREKNTLAVSEENNAVNAIKTEVTPSTESFILDDFPNYLAKNEGELSELDFETAYEMCVRALTDYYKAVWNGSDIELDTFVDSNNLKQYKQMKIQSQYDLHDNLTNNSVQDIESDAWEVEYIDDVDGGYLYLSLSVKIQQSLGGYGEATEFLVRNLNGKLVIVDWYTGTKDSYDFLVRGENQTIDNPNIWNDSEWVKKLNSKQIEFPGTTR